ncbi:MAG: S8 family serine peptidase [Mucilaginibacter polytrichastri]|nr:S8 family serine peptidase [Mucilaginibacter polytrichastri]
MKQNLIRTGLFALAGFFIAHVAEAQPQPAPAEKPLPKNWHTLDLATDGYYGISLQKAYDAIKKKKTKTVLVAVIDSGADTVQTDLKDMLWINKKEIAGNGKDDDGNGYVDDIHGWNFLGGPGGTVDNKETTEEVREYNRLKPVYEGQTNTTAKDKKEFAYWQQVKATYDSTIAKSGREIQQIGPQVQFIKGSNAYLRRKMNLNDSATYTVKELQAIKDTSNDTLKYARQIWIQILGGEGPDKTDKSFIKGIDDYIQKLQADLQPNLNARKEIVGDDPNDLKTKGYGNNLVKFDDASHGTGVAGLIGAKRGNNYGIDGVAADVQIMPIKAVPDGDEYDKDVANAIRYAVDNGAQIVNMSFGKKLSPQKAYVDAAFKYAHDNGVLLVQAAGNDNQNMDKKPQFPNDTFADGSVTDLDNVIAVGASGPKKDEHLAGSFSNYGKTKVDVFAPGVKVTSIDLNAEFNTADGTSFASPVTAGVAALVLSYYPKLSAAQLKQVILQSAEPVKGLMVFKPGSKTDKVDFTTLSKTGGIVNAARALEIAKNMKGDRKKSRRKS